jgi:hypothetical protein
MVEEGGKGGGIGCAEELPQGEAHLADYLAPNG